MTKQGITTTLQFMERVQLTGKEAIAWVKCYEELLTDLAQSETAIPPNTTKSGSTQLVETVDK